MQRVCYRICRHLELPAGDDWLSPAETGVLALLKVPKRRADWRLGRWTAKQAARACLPPSDQDLPLQRLEICAAPDGAPELFRDGKHLPVSLSISHSEGTALAAVIPSPARVGCDIQEIRPLDSRFIEDYFTATEQRQFAVLDPEQRWTIGTLFWSAKESALKVLREGMRRDTRSVEVLALHGNLRENEDWRSMACRCLVSGRIFSGWHRREGRFVMVILSDFPLAPPAAPA